MIDPKKTADAIANANQPDDGETIEVSLSAGKVRGSFRVGHSVVGGMAIDEGEFERVRDEAILPALDKRRVGNHANIGALYVRNGEIVDAEIDDQYLRDSVR